MYSMHFHLDFSWAFSHVIKKSPCEVSKFSNNILDI